eukprot:10480618-Lingulodinium_polyedra.AAC.1
MSKAAAKSNGKAAASSSKAASLASKHAASSAARPKAGTGTGRKVMRTVEAIAVQSLRDNFKGWGDCEIHAHLVQGQSLYQKLCEDISKNLEEKGARPMGGPYYSQLKIEHASGKNPLLLLAVHNKLDPLHPELEKAMHALKDRNSLKQPFLDYFASSSRPNQRELVGVARAALSMKPS